MEIVKPLRPLAVRKDTGERQETDLEAAARPPPMNKIILPLAGHYLWSAANCAVSINLGSPKHRATTI
jgi:hypothetical protein